MWKPFLISCCLLMLRSASGQLSVSDLEKMLLESLSTTTTTTTTTANPLLQRYKLCDHESGEEARCVKKSLCNVAGPPLDPATQFDYRELDEAGACTYLQTCCPESQINLEKVSLPLVTRPVGCGYSNPGATVLRELGSDSGYADYGEFPWMVALINITKVPNKRKNVDDTVFHDAYFGGGTLIDPSVVLTVAHKVDEIKASNIPLPLVDGDSCQKKNRKTKLGPYYKLHRSLTCAGGVPNVDTCFGDGGSSLVCPIPDKTYMRYSVVGMVVYGLDCGSKLPGVYAKVPEVYDWVQNTLVSEGFTTTPFKKD